MSTSSSFDEHHFDEYDGLWSGGPVRPPSIPSTPNATPQRPAELIMIDLTENIEVEYERFEDIVRMKIDLLSEKKDMSRAVRCGVEFLQLNPCLQRDEYQDRKEPFLALDRNGLEQLEDWPDLELRRLFWDLCYTVLELMEDVYVNGNDEECSEITDGLGRLSNNTQMFTWIGRPET